METLSLNYLTVIREAGTSTQTIWHQHINSYSPTGAHDMMTPQPNQKTGPRGVAATEAGVEGLIEGEVIQAEVTGAEEKAAEAKTRGEAERAVEDVEQFRRRSLSGVSHNLH